MIRFFLMLFSCTLFLFWTIIIIVAVHYAALFIFLRRLNSTNRYSDHRVFTPKILVLFPLRGADPSLSGGLQKVLTQDYPNYQVRFLLDSVDDPALPFVESAIKQYDDSFTEIKIVQEHFPTCSLKCGALYYGVSDIDPSFEAVVIFDADSNPPSDCLLRLVAPLADDQFPAATGLRWYIPDRINAGSLVRYLWNAAAVVQQHLYRIPWGGALALRRDLLNNSTLLDRWKNSLADDTSVPAAVKEIGGNVAVVPALFLANRETCSLRSFYRWVQRQMLSVKLYHSAWPAVLGQAVFLTLPLVALLGTLFAGLFLQYDAVVLFSLWSFFTYWAGVFGTVPIIERAIRRIFRQNGEEIRRWTTFQALLTLALVPVTQFVYTAALFRLHFIRLVEWRGVKYEVSGKTIRLIKYETYTTSPAEEGHSL